MDANEVTVHAADGVSPPLPLEEVERAVREVLRAEGVGAAELSVILLTDREIAEMNERYLSHEGPTDVISFPLHPEGGAPLGDVYVGAEQAARQAAELGIPAREEVLRLAVHGTLHVLGYDHPEGDGREASEMYRRQEELLAAILGRR